jgi:hypothetical protein
MNMRTFHADLLKFLDLGVMGEQSLAHSEVGAPPAQQFSVKKPTRFDMAPKSAE